MRDRDITKVIDDMLDVIPDGETALRASLRSVRNTACYTAPEAMGYLWRKVYSVLVTEVPQPTKTWHIAMARIFRGEE